jgi:uncharacterized membrane protein YkvI
MILSFCEEGILPFLIIIIIVIMSHYRWRTCKKKYCKLKENYFIENIYLIINKSTL